MFNASPIASTKNIARTNTQKKLKKESRYVTIKKNQWNTEKDSERGKEDKNTCKTGTINNIVISVITLNINTINSSN